VMRCPGVWWIIIASERYAASIFNVNENTFLRNSGKALQTTRCHIPGESNLHKHQRDIINSVQFCLVLYFLGYTVDGKFPSQWEINYALRPMKYGQNVLADSMEHSPSSEANARTRWC
jgi:hypothetical protein